MKKKSQYKSVANEGDPLELYSGFRRSLIMKSFTPDKESILHFNINFLIIYLSERRPW